MFEKHKKYITTFLHLIVCIFPFLDFLYFSEQYLFILFVALLISLIIRGMKKYSFIFLLTCLLLSTTFSVASYSKNGFLECRIMSNKSFRIFYIYTEDLSYYDYNKIKFTIKSIGIDKDKFYQEYTDEDNSTNCNSLKFWQDENGQIQYKCNYN